MKNSKLQKEDVVGRFYTPPVCRFFYFEPGQFMCVSQTEPVGEIEGEW